jgi:hypothetical protein
MARAGSTVTYPYTATLGYDLFQDTSKDALAAVVVSLLSGGGDRPDDVRPGLIAELVALADAGIIPRRPAAKYVTELADRPDADV